MYKYPSALVLLIFLIPSSICLGKGNESHGQQLVSRYLRSTDTNEMEEIFKTISELNVSVNEVKKWVTAAADYLPHKPGLHRKLASVGERKGEYFVYVPSSYVPGKPWPVVLALHGVGANGYEQVMAWLKFSTHNDEFILVGPTYGPGLWWNEEAEKLILSVFDQVKREYHIDTNRVYITGFSSGGHGAWYMAIRYPWLFAATNPIAGECPIPSLLVNLLHVPVYIVHGVKDMVIPVEAARDARLRLEKLGYRFMYKELPELKHRLPVTQINEVLDWFRLNTRSLYPKEIQFSTDSTRYPVSYWIEIGEFTGLVGQISGIRRDPLRQPVRPEGLSVHATIEANIKEEDNEIYLKTREIKALRLYLGDKLIHMEKPLRVYINGKVVYSGKVDESVRVVLDTVKKRKDRNALFSAYLDLKVPTVD